MSVDLAQEGMIEGWIWSKVAMCLIDQKWLLSRKTMAFIDHKVGLGSHVAQVGLIEGWIWSKVALIEETAYVLSIQRWL